MCDMEAKLTHKSKIGVHVSATLRDRLSLSLGPGSILVTTIHPDKNACFRGPNYVKAQDGPCYQLLSDWLLWL